MYQFVLNMWVFKKITESQVNSYATKGFIFRAGSTANISDTAGGLKSVLFLFKKEKATH